MALRYVGTADPFNFNGKDYHPGDSVPISKTLAEHHARFSKVHRFEDSDGDVLPSPTPMAEPADLPKKAP